MESLGQKLKNRREEKSVSVEQVSRETNIAKSYIRAMEDEEFTVFPGEPYLMGFLRNYSEYLDFNADEILQLYRNYKIQEQPVPMDVLIPKKGPNFVLIALILVGLTAVGVSAFLFGPQLLGMFQTQPGAEYESRPAALAVSEPETYILSDGIVERLFFLNQIIEFPFQNQVYRFVITDIGETLELSTQDAVYSLNLGQAFEIDVNNNHDADLLVSVQSINADDNSAILRFDRFVVDTLSSSPETAEEEEEVLPLVSLGTAAVQGREREILSIASRPAPVPFSVRINFRGYSLIRYIRDKEERQESYFSRDEVVHILDIDESLMLWLSNSGAVQVSILGNSVNVGRAGEVSAKKIFWQKNEAADNYVLVAVPMY